MECIQFGRQVIMVDLRQERLGFVAGQIPWRFSFPRNSGFARLCGLRDPPVLPYAGEPRRGLSYAQDRRRAESFCRGCDCKVAPNCAGSVDKTKAFEFALDFATSNAPEVIHQLYGLIADNLPAYKAMGPAKRYEHLAGPMASTRASPVVRPRICWAITLAAAVFSFLLPIG